jgi:hypothetical protein
MNMLRVETFRDAHMPPLYAALWAARMLNFWREISFSKFQLTHARLLKCGVEEVLCAKSATSRLPHVGSNLPNEKQHDENI